MPITPTYPGVYVEEVPSGARTITGVSTSIAAFIGRFKQGVLNTPIHLYNQGDFERELGGLDTNSEAGFAIQQFFLGGGSEAYAVRVANRATASTFDLPGELGGTALTVEAGQAYLPNDEAEHEPGDSAGPNPGIWGDMLRVRIDYPTPTSNSRFNLYVELMAERNGRLTVVRSEEFLNLSMTSTDEDYVQKAVNDQYTGSSYVRVKAFPAQGRPRQNGTLTTALNPLPASSAGSVSFDVSIFDDSAYPAGTPSATGSATVTLSGDRESIRKQLQSAIRASNPSSRAIAGATVTTVDNSFLLRSGAPEEADEVIVLSGGTDLLLRSLGFGSGPTALQGLLSDTIAAVDFGALAGDLDITVAIGGGAPLPVTVNVDGMADMSDLASALQTAIRAQGDALLVDVIVVAREGATSDTGELIVLSPQGAVVVDGTNAPDLELDPGSAEGPVSGALSSAVTSDALNGSIDVTIDGTTHTIAVASGVTAIADKANALETALRAESTAADDGWDQAVVAAFTADGEDQLVIVPGEPNINVAFAAAAVDANTALLLGLNAASIVVEEQRYALAGGGDRNALTSADLIGDLASKTGVYALEDCDIFNILCIPSASALSVGGDAVMTAAIAYCEDRRAIFLMDPAPGVNDPDKIRIWLEANATLRHRNAALYFPRITIADPTNGYRPRYIAPCGTIAGLIAKTDATRGVWKAPAGIEAGLTGVSKLNYEMTDAENGSLNPLGINCLRRFPVYGQVSWGARTLDGADIMASEWKYLPVRRTALYIQESLFRGTKWAVFEPNDEPLWSQIRVSVTAFMHRLYRQGAFQGSSPKQAYLVKCDGETTTQNDIDLGIVNIVVGFRPLKVAEFIILQIQQLANSD
ncbi:MAG: phage tail sheath subtilisin-like domain-containing protein [Phycisphaerales bacterium]